MHWARNKKHGTPGAPGMMHNAADSTLPERLAKFGWTVTASGCWEWNGSCYQSGYGHLYFQGRDLYAHRLSFELHNGPIPKGMFICHTCDNPPCMNPAHLFAGTPADNSADMRNKGRNRRGVANRQAKLSEDDVREIRRLAKAGESRLLLSERFGVTQSGIYGVVMRINWKHIE
jgi:hypothetical protein